MLYLVEVCFRDELHHLQNHLIAYCLSDWQLLSQIFLVEPGNYPVPNILIRDDITWGGEYSNIVDSTQGQLECSVSLTTDIRYRIKYDYN